MTKRPLLINAIQNQYIVKMYRISHHSINHCSIFDSPKVPNLDFTGKTNRISKELNHSLIFLSFKSRSSSLKLRRLRDNLHLKECRSWFSYIRANSLKVFIVESRSHKISWSEYFQKFSQPRRLIPQGSYTFHWSSGCIIVSNKLLTININ